MPPDALLRLCVRKETEISREKSHEKEIRNYFNAFGTCDRGCVRVGYFIDWSGIYRYDGPGFSNGRSG